MFIGHARSQARNQFAGVARTLKKIAPRTAYAPTKRACQKLDQRQVVYLPPIALVNTTRNRNHFPGNELYQPTT
jgi:hypothetical protein